MKMSLKLVAAAAAVASAFALSACGDKKEAAPAKPATPAAPAAQSKAAGTLESRFCVCGSDCGRWLYKTT